MPLLKKLTNSSAVRHALQSHMRYVLLCAALLSEMTIESSLFTDKCSMC